MLQTNNKLRWFLVIFLETSVKFQIFRRVYLFFVSCHDLWKYEENMYHTSKKIKMIFSYIFKDLGLEFIKIKYFNFCFNVLQNKIWLNLVKYFSSFLDFICFVVSCHNWKNYEYRNNKLKWFLVTFLQTSISCCPCAIICSWHCQY